MIPGLAPAYGGLAPIQADVMTPAGMVSTMGYGTRFGQGPMGMPVGQAIAAQYMQVRAASGLPAATIVSPLGFGSKRVRRHKRKDITLHIDSILTGPAIALHIPCRVAKHFDVCSLRIGQYYLIGTGGCECVDAELYSLPGGVAIPLPGGVLLPGQRICLTVKNRSRSSHTFRASILAAVTV